MHADYQLVIEMSIYNMGLEGYDVINKQLVPAASCLFKIISLQSHIIYRHLDHQLVVSMHVESLGAPSSGTKNLRSSNIFSHHSYRIRFLLYTSFYFSQQAIYMCAFVLHLNHHVLVVELYVARLSCRTVRHETGSPKLLKVIYP